MGHATLRTEAANFIQAMRGGMLYVFDRAAAITPAFPPLRALHKTNGAVHQYSWLPSAFQWYRLRIDATLRNSFGSWDSPALDSRSATAA